MMGDDAAMTSASLIRLRANALAERLERDTRALSAACECTIHGIQNPQEEERTLVTDQSGGDSDQLQRIAAANRSRGDTRLDVRHGQYQAAVTSPDRFTLQVTSPSHAMLVDEELRSSVTASSTGGARHDKLLRALSNLVRDGGAAPRGSGVPCWQRAAPGRAFFAVAGLDVQRGRLVRHRDRAHSVRTALVFV
eukprot:SAG11_NODE_1157_length_5657_cov_30.018712_3_plen_194_part_00